MTNIIENLQPYILNNSNIINYLKYKFKTINERKYDDKKYHDKKDIIKNIDPVFIPREKDTLFWCYYIISNGDIKYEMLNNKNVIFTKQEKINLIKKIRENKHVIKTHKFDTISNIESNLANDDFTNIKSIMSLCAIDNLNIIFVKNKTYYELITNDSDSLYIIWEKENHSKYNKKYGFELAETNILDKIRNSYYKLEKLDKPIKSVSSYKLDELIEIAKKLSISTIDMKTGKNKKKNEIYEAIIQYF